MPELSAAEMQQIGLDETFNVNASNSGFADPRKLGLPMASETQLKAVSQMLSQKCQGMTEAEIDKVILSQ